MGSNESRLGFRRAIVQLETGNRGDDEFWANFWRSDGVDCASDVWALVPSSEVRALREEYPSSLATLCYKAVDRLDESLKLAIKSSEGGRSVLRETLNAVRLLTRLAPLIYEDSEWIGFFHSKIPNADGEGTQSETLAQKLVTIIIELMFVPGIGAHHSAKSGESSLECIWEAGVGVLHSPPSDSTLDNSRAELVRLLITLSSEPLYAPPVTHGPTHENTWVILITKSKHSLSILASLINTICSYDPSGVPYHHLLWTDTREPLVEVCCQLLVICFEKRSNDDVPNSFDDENGNKFLFLVSRLHREEDFQFIIKGLTRLIYNPLQSSYLPSSQKRLSCHQELLLLIWRLCDANKKFLHHILKTSDMLDLLVPILHHLNEARADPSRLGLIHISVFLLLLLSGERNFGVRLNAPWTSRAALDVPSFHGTHADLLIIIFHKLITTGHARVSSLYDCLLTVIVNISPYLKRLTMATTTKLLHLMEAFSQPSFLFAQQQNHHLVFFLLESLNNLIQYQFDGNAPLVYCIIRRRRIFHQLAALPTDETSIDRVRTKRTPKRDRKLRHEKLAQIEKEHRENDRESDHKDLSNGTTVKVENSIIDDNDDDDNRSTLSLSLNKLSADADHSLQVTPGTPVTSCPSDSSDVASLPNTEMDQVQIQHLNNIPDVGKMTEEVVDGNTKTHVLSSDDEGSNWQPNCSWATSWKSRLPLQTIMRLLQVLVPQVEKICLDKQISDEGDILKFIQQGTLVGLLPVPHPILIRRYQTNLATNRWLQTYTWGVIYLRNSDPPIWYDTDVKLFEIQRY